MATTRVDINKPIIEWAIIRAGHELPEYLRANPKVNQWLTQEKKPTVKQLEAFSKNVHVPFGYLFLPTPPKEELNFPFFRTGKGATKTVPLNVFDTIQIIRHRQDWLSEYLREEDYTPLSFVGKFDQHTNVQTFVEDMRNVLQLADNWASYHDTWEKALDFLSLRVEEIGVVINFSGIVGNNTRRPIAVEDCRGLVLIDEFAPFMFINSADAKAAQLFTIIHELAHIWLGKSAGFDMKGLLPSDDPIERLCDQVAAEFLVPKVYLLKIWQTEQDFQKLNRTFKVSPIVVARRALDLGLINKDRFFAFYNTYLTKFNAQKSKRGGGGDFYATARKRVSLRFASFVNRAVNEQKLLYRDAYQLTNLTGNTYANFVKEYLYQV